MKIDNDALNKHSFADLISIRDFALNMQARLQRKADKEKTSFELSAYDYWVEVSKILDLEMSKRAKVLFEQEIIPDPAI